MKKMLFTPFSSKIKKFILQNSNSLHIKTEKFFAKMEYA